MKRKMCEMKNLKNGDGYRVIWNCKAQTFKKNCIFTSEMESVCLPLFLSS